MKSFVDRHPFAYVAVIMATLLGFAYLSRLAFPTAVLGSAAEVAPDTATTPSAIDRVLVLFRDAQALFWSLTLVLSSILFSILGWSGVGFEGSVRWRNLYLLWFPLGVAALSLAGGVGISGGGYLLAALIGVLLAVVGEEIVFRGVLWRALIPKGPIAATLTTALLTGTLYLINATLASRPLPETVFNTLTATCAAVTYGALRWRTGALWPVVLVHVILAYARAVSTPSIEIYRISLYVTTIGFVLYGLFLLRNRRARTDGGSGVS